MKRTQYPLTAGIYTPIPALQFSRKVELTEDGSVQAQGLQVKYPLDGFQSVYTYAPDAEPVEITESVPLGAGQGILLGWPQQTGINQRAADTYCMVSCAGGTSLLNVLEYD